MVHATSNAVSLQMPQFLSNAKGRNVFNFIERELNSCNEFFMSVAFITKGGITPFLQTLKEQEEKNIKGRVLTTDYLLFSDPDALDVLNSLKNVELRMYETQKKGNKGFHTKGYVFKSDKGYNVIIGSSNLTQSALFKNFEWNVQCCAGQDATYVQSVKDEFKELWNESTVYDECRDRYKASYETGELIRNEIKENISNLDFSNLPEIKPNQMQKAFISNLNDLVDKGEKRALLVSATGTGKTYASALAVKDLMQKMKSQKILFVSHREQINKQALDSYVKIFGNNFRMGLFSGNYNSIEEAKKCNFLFSTVQTLSKDRVLQQFSEDEYSIIILDECHRVGADSYQKIINYFEPDLLLGMSASPERTDGFDVFKLFDYNIAYEIRLQQALENELLCPFHYFGITDLFVNNEEHDTKDFNLLASAERVDYIISKAKYYGHSGKRTKGLAFCSRKEEADRLSEMFNARGLRSVSLSGDNSQEERHDAIERLESDCSENRLDYIFTVDIFNEGVDIPQINQILLLRPTQSPIIFVQQVGRGLRKFKNKEYVVILDFIGNYNNNYMIPIALSGDRSGNKDNMRRCLLEPNELLNGASTIHFDTISRQRIYASIDSAKMNTSKALKEGYTALKMKLGRIPNLIDFDSFGELDPLRIVQYSGSYHNFLAKYEEDYKVKLNVAQNKMVDFISAKLLSGKRVQELLLLDVLVNHHTSNALGSWKKRLKEEYDITTDPLMIRNVINVLSKTFYDIGAVKGQIEECLFVTEEGKIHPLFATQLDSSVSFKKMIQELIEFGLGRNRNVYGGAGSFVLYKKYTYDDVCRLLNWRTNEVSTNIGGYKHDKETNTFPVFINYDKAEDISDSIKYEDTFVDNNTLIAISKGKRSLKSNDVQTIIHSDESNTQIHLFVRKNKDDKESKEFYYLGRMSPTKNVTEFKMANGNNAVEFEYKLATAVPESLYEYIITNK